MIRAIKYLAILALAGTIQSAVAENVTEVDGYSIHHNALTTDSLTPSIAATYKIQRSKNRGMLTVSVLKKQPNGQDMAVKAEIKVTATNENGQLQGVTLHEITEGAAVYYIGDFRVANEETFKFKLEVTPEGAGRTYEASLTQEFVVTD